MYKLKAMKKARKNFIFDKKMIERMEKIAKKNKRSLTKQIEIICEKCIAEDGDEFFEYVSKRS